MRCEQNVLKIILPVKNGVRKLLIVEKEEASAFQAADLATTVADMLAELYC